MRKGFTLYWIISSHSNIGNYSPNCYTLIMDVIDDVRINSFNIETSNVEKATEHYLATELNLGDIPKYKEYYIPVNSLTKYLKKTKNKMLDEYVIVKKTDYNINYYYTGRDKNPYLKIGH